MKIFRSRKVVASIAMILSSIAYGLFTGVQKNGIKETPNTFEFACYTMVFSSLVLFPLIIKPIRKDQSVLFSKKSLLFLVILSISVQVGAATLKLFALKETTATSVSFIASFSAVTLLFYGVVLNKENLPKGFVAVVSLMMIGLLLFRIDENLKLQFGIGEIFMLIFINIVSLANTSVKRYVNFNSPFVVSFGRMFFSIVPLALLAYFTGANLSLNSLFSKGAILAGVLFGAKVVLMYFAISITRLQNVAVFNIFSPIITFSYAFLFLGETLTFVQGVGAALIVFGGYLIARMKLRMWIGVRH